MDKSNILITGGAGFIGSAVALKLLKLGHEVYVLDNLSEQIHGEIPEDSTTYKKVSDKVHFFKGSVEAKEDWENLIDKVDYIIHLAAETGTGQSMYQIKRYTDVNIGGTSIMLELLTNERHSIKKIVFASSRAVYGEGKYICENDGIVYPKGRLSEHLERGDFSVKCPICGSKVQVDYTDEESQLSPSSVYGYTKQAQEQLCSIVCEATKIPYVGLRFQNVYGPGQSLHNPYTGILSIFSNLLLQNKEINIFEDGKETRDFVYIDDIVDAIILSLFNKNVFNEIFNVGSGEKNDVLTVAKTLKDLYKSKSKITISGNYRVGDIRHNIADLTKANNILHYSPKIDFKTGIINFTNWVKEERVSLINYETSIEEMKSKGLLR